MDKQGSFERCRIGRRGRGRIDDPQNPPLAARLRDNNEEQTALRGRKARADQGETVNVSPP